MAKSTNTNKLIAAQEVARIAINCTNDRSDAIRFLERDYNRQWEEWDGDPENAEKPLPRSIKLVESALQFLRDNPKWDGRVQYELIDPNAMEDVK